MTYYLFEKPGESARVYGNGYVTYSAGFDRQFADEDAAIAELQRDGFEFVGADRD